MKLEVDDMRFATPDEAVYMVPRSGHLCRLSEDNSKKGGPEAGQRIAADSSVHGGRQLIALTADRRRSTSLTSQDQGRRQSLGQDLGKRQSLSQDLGRRQSLGRDLGRHTSLESIGSQELFGWHLDGKMGEPIPGGPAESNVIPGRPVLQTAASYNRSPRLPKFAKKLEE